MTVYYSITVYFHRYINHASVNYNLAVMKPVMVGDPPSQRLRIGFVARRDITKGEELFLTTGSKIKPSLGLPRILRRPGLGWIHVNNSQ